MFGKRINRSGEELFNGVLMWESITFEVIYIGLFEEGSARERGFTLQIRILPTRVVETA